MTCNFRVVEDAADLNTNELLDSLPGIVFARSMAHEWPLSYLSAGALSITGFAAEELLAPGNAAFNALIHPSDLPQLLRAIHAAVHGGNVYHVEYRITLKNKQVRWLAERGQVIRNPRNIIVGLQGFITDIHDLKLAENERYVAEEKYRDLFTNAVEGIFRSSLEGRYLSVNPALAAMYGYDSAEELIQQMDDLSVQLYAEPGRRAEFVQIMLRHGRVEKFESEVITRQGQRIWISENARVVRGTDGGILCFEGTVVDISERRVSVQRLASEKNLLRALIDHWPDAIYAKDHLGNYTLSNMTHTHSLGMHSSKEIEGRKTSDFFLASRAAELEAEDLQVLATGVSVLNREELRQDAGNSKQSWVLISKIPIMGDHGRVQGLVSVTRDISEHKRLEMQLNHSQKMEAIGRLAGGVAHDFNNILTAILGYSDLIANDRALPENTRSNVREITAGAMRAAALTQQLLAFSRKQNIRPSVLNLNEVILKLENMLHRLIGENISLRTRLDGALSPIKADSGQLEQVLVNMVVNARDAMPKGGRLTIETRDMQLDESFTSRYSDLTPGAYARISISDNGEGIPREIQSHIFEPFFTTKGQGKGTGLGLATCYGIIKQNGGHVSVYSEVGSGTTFNIYLPALEGEAPLEIVKPDTCSGALPGGHEVVLLVEDDAAVRVLTTSLLMEFGYRVLSAVDGQEALEMVRKQVDPPIDLVLTDVVMPNLGGRELALHLSELAPHIKVLFSSGYNEEAIHHQGLLEGKHAFLQKPYSAMDLATAMRSLLDMA